MSLVIYFFQKWLNEEVHYPSCFVCYYCDAAHMYYVCIAEDRVNVSACEDGDVRLRNAGSLLEGRLEICVNRVWGTVCSNGFGQSEARVACRKLPFASGENVV